MTPKIRTFTSTQRMKCKNKKYDQNAAMSCQQLSQCSSSVPLGTRQFISRTWSFSPRQSRRAHNLQLLPQKILLIMHAPISPDLMVARSDKKISSSRKFMRFLKSIIASEKKRVILFLYCFVMETYLGGVFVEEKVAADFSGKKFFSVNFFSLSPLQVSIHLQISTILTSFDGT